MSDTRVVLDAAAFVDSVHALRVDAASTDQIRTIAQRFFSVCYADIGKAPRLLDGDDLRTVLCELLPRHFGVKDTLAQAVPTVLKAILNFLSDTAIVSNRFELDLALAEHGKTFQAVVAAGNAHAQGIAITEKHKPFVHRANKTGRNDPCPCGSGKKLKKCCGR